jgi:hypothetical protein
MTELIVLGRVRVGDDGRTVPHGPSHRRVPAFELGNGEFPESILVLIGP